MNLSERRYDVKKEPVLRFPGFEGEWEQRKLGELCQIEKGKQINKKTLSTSGKYYVLNGGINPSGYTDKFNTEANTISINEGGSCGFVKLNTTRFWSGGHNYTLLKPKCEVKYLYNYLKYREKYINSLAVGTGIPNIQKKVLQEAVSVSYPPIQEQTKIGSFLATIDALISETEKELEACREQKRGMLQKMFPKKGADMPEIRFPGFTDAWEQRKFGDVGSVAMCKRIFKEQTSDEGDVPFYKIGTFGGEPDAYISQELFDEYKAKYPFPNKGDILISASGSIGRTVEFTGGNEYFQDSNIVWLKHGKDIDNSFLKILYNVVEWSCEGSTIKRLYNDNFLKTEFMLPNIDEQKKIGEYFCSLDNLITLHQRELDRLLEMKKGFMQKMFC